MILRLQKYNLHSCKVLPRVTDVEYSIFARFDYHNILCSYLLASQLLQLIWLDFGIRNHNFQMHTNCVTPFPLFDKHTMLIKIHSGRPQGIRKKAPTHQNIHPDPCTPIDPTRDLQ